MEKVLTDFKAKVEMRRADAACEAQEHQQELEQVIQHIDSQVDTVRRIKLGALTVLVAAGGLAWVSAGTVGVALMGMEVASGTAGPALVGALQGATLLVPLVYCDCFERAGTAIGQTFVRIREQEKDTKEAVKEQARQKHTEIQNRYQRFDTGIEAGIAAVDGALDAGKFLAETAERMELIGARIEEQSKEAEGFQLDLVVAGGAAPALPKAIDRRAEKIGLSLTELRKNAQQMQVQAEGLKVLDVFGGPGLCDEPPPNKSDQNSSGEMPG